MTGTAERITAPLGLSAFPSVRLGRPATAVSILIASGASIVELAAVMGWAKSTAAAMAVRYRHLFEARANQLTDAVENLYRATVEARRSGLTGGLTTACTTELWPQSGLPCSPASAPEGASCP